jgi:SAM-dependent methyltransferase
MTDFDRLALYYDLEHDDYVDDIPLYAGFARATPEGAGILELACGTGRCLLPLAGAGYEVTGLDVSPAMLDLLREKAATAGEQVAGRIRTVEGDMRDFSLGRRFGFVFIALNSLMHLETQAEQRAALACAARHLEPGGRLLVDLFNPDVALPDPEQEGQLFLHCLKTLPDGRHLLHFQSPAIDRARQLISMTNYYDGIAADGTVKRHLAPFNLRYLTRAELDLLLPASGLSLECLYGSYDLEPFQAGSPRLIVAASSGGATSSGGEGAP